MLKSSHFRYKGGDSVLQKWLWISLLLSSIVSIASADLQLGIDRLFHPEYVSMLHGKHIGLLTNHTAINRNLQLTRNILKEAASTYRYTIVALFAPEHGLYGMQHASESVKESKDPDGLPIYSLHGTTKRPTAEMLKGIDLLIYDIQDLGSRSYTYVSTLFYLMEEAAKHKIPVIVLDRPNPINGVVVDGPPLEEKWRSIVGYVNVCYCHGMTVGELARYFNEEYRVGCSLTVVPMEGWKRWMSFSDTGLPWVPTSPNVPEPTTPLYYPVTGILGELQIVNIGVGYTLPFKVIGAPWIDAELFAKKLNDQHFPGVYFSPFYYRPFFGRFAQENCSGVLIMITDPESYLPVMTQYLIIGTLKSLYPSQFQKALKESLGRIPMFNKVNGTDEVYRILQDEKYVVWPLKKLLDNARAAFLLKRNLYLLPHYQ